MNRSESMTRALLIVASLVLCGCASRKPAIDSTADLSYTKTIHKVYVVAQLPRTAGGEVLFIWGESTLVSRTDPERRVKLYQSYANAMENAFQKIGIEAKCEVLSGLELDESAVEKNIAAFAPDAYLTVDCVGITLRNGEFIGASYDVSLIDYPSEKRVWRGKFSVTSMFSPYADALARKQFSIITTQLKEDKMEVLGTLEK